jgi:23S rRNA pseudouridine955/2504/2580 synthase
MKARPPVFDILFEDNRIVCFNKPPGLPMHPAAEVGPENLVDLGGSFLHDRDRAAHPHAAPPTFNLRPVNRLDRGTSGAVILAKSSSAAGMFGKLVMEEGLGKLYLALVAGKLSGSGEITAPVDGKESLTRYLSLYSGRDSSLVALWPETGRMHQLRRHLSSIGYPIIGDKRYGGPLLPSLPGFALHAFLTEFTRPETLQETLIHAPLPYGFRDELQKLCGTAYTSILQRLAELTPSP